MMEKEPIFEESENPEQKLIRLLREKGIKDPKTVKFLDSWTREQEKQVEQSGDYLLKQIQFNLKRARLYLGAGYTDEAFENFEVARTQTWNEQRHELYRAIMKEMDEIEESLGNKK